MTITTTELSEGAHWLHECYNLGDEHMHFSEFLFQSEEANVLVGIGPSDWEELRAVVQDLTDGQGLDVVILTNAILPHTTNLAALLNEWEGIVLYSPEVENEMMGMPGAAKFMKGNSTIEIEDQTFSAINPVMTDVVMTNWVFSHEFQVLVTAEGVGNYHPPGTCEETFGTIDEASFFDGLHRFHHDKLPPLELMDAEKIRSAFERIVDTYDIEYITPIHGTPIEVTEFDRYLDVLIRSVEESETPLTAALG